MSKTKKQFTSDFPAKLVVTSMNWGDLMLNPKTTQQINDIKLWLNEVHSFKERSGADKAVKPGYIALFYGPSGTEKTLAATLLGKQYQRDVYYIDLSQDVSNYIGETEKNLRTILNEAEGNNYILFFDEADALFGKRSKEFFDMSANQKVSYLLQLVEDFPGLIIFAANNKSNIDQAFLRRLNVIIHFPIPKTK